MDTKNNLIYSDKTEIATRHTDELIKSTRLKNNSNSFNSLHLFKLFNLFNFFNLLNLLNSLVNNAGKPKRKAQSSVEFIIIMGFAIMFMIVMAMVLQSGLADANKERDDIRVMQIMNILNSEILFAEQSDSGYSRVFFLPYNINGVPYSLNLREKIEVVIEYKGKQHVFFLTTDIEDAQHLNNGYNRINKTCTSFSCRITLGTA